MTRPTGPDSRRSLAVAVTTLLVVTAALAPFAGTAVAAAESEPNDSREDAQSITTGTTITGDIDPKDDVDWFAFTAEKGEAINVTVSAGSGGTNNFKLFTRTTKRGDVDLNDAAGSIGTTARYTGTYYVQIGKDFFASQGTNYTLEVETYRTDDFEPSENRSMAEPISTGTPVDGEVEPKGDVDWFEFTAERGQTINVTASAGAGGTNNVKLFAGRTKRGGINIGNATGSLGTTARYTGTYYVRVGKDFYASQGTNYSFEVETYRTDDFEPNENRSMATQLFENPFTPAAAELSIGDEDFFGYQVEAGETIRAVASTPTDGTEHALRIYEPGGSFAANQTGVEPGTTATLTYTAGTTGRHNVAIEPSAFGGIGAYNVTMTIGGETVGPPNDRFERRNPPIGNQDPANATALGSGTYTDLGMVDDDRDVFAVDLETGERVAAGIEFTHAENDLALAVTDGTGTTLNSSDSGSDGEAVGHTARSDGTYYLRVSGEPGASTTYDLDLAVLGQLDVTLGPASASVAPNTTRTFDVVVSNVTAGLANATLDLSSSDTSALTIESVDVAGTGSVSADVAADGSTANATVSGLPADASGAVTIATVTVETGASGTATLDGDATVSADGGAVYPSATVRPSTISASTCDLSSFVQGYDGDDDCAISLTELGQASVDFANGDISLVQLGRVSTAFANT